MAPARVRWIVPNRTSWKKKFKHDSKNQTKESNKSTESEIVSFYEQRYIQQYQPCSYNAEQIISDGNFAHYPFPSNLLKDKTNVSLKCDCGQFLLRRNRQRSKNKPCNLCKDEIGWSRYRWSCIECDIDFCSIHSKQIMSVQFESVNIMNDIILDENINDEIKAKLMEECDILLGFIYEDIAWSHSEMAELSFLTLWNMMNSVKIVRIEPIIGSLLYLLPSYKHGNVSSGRRKDSVFEQVIKQSLFEKRLSNKELRSVALEICNNIDWNEKVSGRHRETLHHFLLDFVQYLNKNNIDILSELQHVVKGTNIYIPADIQQEILKFHPKSLRHEIEKLAMSKSESVRTKALTLLDQQKLTNIYL